MHISSTSTVSNNTRLKEISNTHVLGGNSNLPYTIDTSTCRYIDSREDEKLRHNTIIRGLIHPLEDKDTSLQFHFPSLTEHVTSLISHFLQSILYVMSLLFLSPFLLSHLYIGRFLGPFALYLILNGNI